MKLPDIYTDWKIVVGLGLIVLGAGNWIIGLQRTQLYSRMIVAHQQPSAAAATDYRSFDELDEGAAVLEPLTAEQRQASYATARMDFYHAAFLTGRVMVLLGVLLTLLGFISVIQQDSRRAFRRPEDDAPIPRGLPGAPRAPQ
jgi:multisubunit Na+/H+ antiporter MnhG subunit